MPVAADVLSLPCRKCRARPGEGCHAVGAVWCPCRPHADRLALAEAARGIGLPAPTVAISPGRFVVTRKGREDLRVRGHEVEVRECPECGRATTFADGRCLPCSLATGQAPAVEDAGA